MSRLSQQRGSAIIVALFVMALAAAAAVAMLSRTSIDIRRTELLINANQANLYAQGSIDWAIAQLTNDLKQKKPDKLVDNTPIHSPTNDVDGFKIQSTILDMQGLYNLNNLNNADSQKNFLRLIHVVDPTLKLGQISQIITATREWITLAKSDELDAYYAKLTPPYRAPHRLMSSLSELRLVKGITPELYNKLLPYITALPEPTPININSATPAIFASLSPTLTLDAASALFQKRRQTPFLTTEAFLASDIIKNNPIKASEITVLSSYFLVKTSVKVGQQETILYTLLLRTTKDSKPYVSALWQTKGTL
jgi:general secretion pathway protein K